MTEQADIREGYCRNDDFHYIGEEESVVCPVCGAELDTVPIGCECDISEEQVDAAIRWHEERRARGSE